MPRPFQWVGRGLKDSQGVDIKGKELNKRVLNAFEGTTSELLPFYVRNKLRIGEFNSIGSITWICHSEWRLHRNQFSEAHVGYTAEQRGSHNLVT